jgi:hypothetical protein
VKREGLDGGYWQMPRWLGDELIDGHITGTTFVLVTLVGSRRDAEAGRPGFATTAEWLADVLDVSDRTIRRSRKQAIERGLLVEVSRKGSAKLRLWLGPRLGGVSDPVSGPVSEVVSEVGSDRRSDTPTPATGLNSGLGAASNVSEPRTLARARARVRETETETETPPTPTSTTDEARDDADANDAAVEGELDERETSSAARGETSTPAGEGADDRDGRGDLEGDLIDEGRVGSEIARQVARLRELAEGRA